MTADPRIAAILASDVRAAARLMRDLDDRRPDAYERVVERLLNSPRYGERWGRHWMDVWRYSDWAGFGAQVRDSQPHIWHWRDWIVESLNADRPYDRMVQEMLAADELAPTDQNALRATGYLVRNYKMLSRETWMQDVVKHTAQAFLGMTLDCARCHDHKYDPISQEDYYRVRAIFEPHHVRTDRVPGELDTTKDGLVRAYDKDLDAATYLFVRGDDRNPDKDRSLAPGLPAAFGGAPLVVEPIALPNEAYYPGLRACVQEDALAACEAALAEAQAEREAARAEKTPGNFSIAEKKCRKAERELAALRARIAADLARFAEPPAADAGELALAAGAAERQAAVAAAELELAVGRFDAMPLIGDDADRKAAEPGGAANEGLAKLGLVLVEGVGINDTGEDLADFVIAARIGFDQVVQIAASPRRFCGRMPHEWMWRRGIIRPLSAGQPP